MRLRVESGDSAIEEARRSCTALQLELEQRVEAHSAELAAYEQESRNLQLCLEEAQAACASSASQADEKLTLLQDRYSTEAADLQRRLEDVTVRMSTVGAEGQAKFDAVLLERDSMALHLTELKTRISVVETEKLRIESMGQEQHANLIQNLHEQIRVLALHVDEEKNRADAWAEESDKITAKLIAVQTTEQLLRTTASDQHQTAAAEMQRFASTVTRLEEQISAKSNEILEQNKVLGHFFFIVYLSYNFIVFTFPPFP